MLLTGFYFNLNLVLMNETDRLQKEFLIKQKKSVKINFFRNFAAIQGKIISYSKKISLLKFSVGRFVTDFLKSFF